MTHDLGIPTASPEASWLWAATAPRLGGHRMQEWWA
jgi:hypothetical protein